jgi:hypothetical protein
MFCVIFLQTLFKQAIEGCIVLTDYNNATYRVTDVDFESTPRSTFESKKKGIVTKISYVDYYYKVSCVFWIGLACILALNLVQPLNFNVAADAWHYFALK